MMTDEPDMTPATRHDLSIWAGAIIAQLTAQLNTTITAALAASEQRIEQRIKQTVVQEIARHTRASAEELKAHMTAMMEPFTDLPARVTKLEELPARVTKLEAKVFASKRRRRS